MLTASLRPMYGFGTALVWRCYGASTAKNRVSAESESEKCNGRDMDVRYGIYGQNQHEEEDECEEYSFW